MSDVMLLGVLRMPIPESPDPMTLRQFVSRARQAADRIEADGAELERLRAELAAERERMNRLYEVVSRIVENDHNVNITRLHDYCFGVTGVSAEAVDGGPVED